jgi:hypothetical protein
MVYALIKGCIDENGINLDTILTQVINIVCSILHIFFLKRKTELLQVLVLIHFRAGELEQHFFGTLEPGPLPKISGAGATKNCTFVTLLNVKK